MHSVLVAAKKKQASDDLLSYKIIETPAEVEFDEIVELAADICQCPIALIGLMDKDRFWIKSKKGTDLTECERQQSFCNKTILSNDLLIVEDALLDEEFRDNPFVLGPMNIRFYAGVPIISPLGNRLGTLCVINNQPGKLSEMQKKSLRLLANQAMRLIELRVKNKIARESIEEKVKQKNRSVLKTVSIQEKKNEYIATALHENLAQALAANKLYLQMAEESEQMRLPLIRKANENLGILVQEICALSNTIVPSALHRIPLEELINNLLEEAKNYAGYTITFSGEGDIDGLNFDYRVVIFKAIEKWLKMLSFREEVSCVNIQLSVFETVILTIEDDGVHHDIDEIGNNEATIKMETRISMLGGTGELTHLQPSGNMLTVMI